MRGRRGVLALAITMIAPAAAQPAAFPAKPIRIVNPYSAGGTTDVVLRRLSQKLVEQWGQPFLIDNRPGGGTIPGTEMVVRAAPDGYTLLDGTSTLAINVHLQAKLPFDALKDLAPVVLLTITPNVLAVHPAVPARSIRELVELARARPGKLTYASAGNGATNHLAMELFKTLAGVDILHIPYKGGAPAVTAMLAGEVDILMNPPNNIMPAHRTGRMRALGVGSAGRTPGIDLPTIAESGVPGFESTVWFALFAPAATPQPLIARINEEVNRALRDKGETVTELTFNLALQLEAHGRDGDAIRAYSEVLKERPLFAEALANMAHVLARLGQAEQSQACWQRAVSVRPELATLGPFSHTRGLVVRPFTKPVPGRTIGAVWRRSTTREAAIRAIGDVVAEAMK